MNIKYLFGSLISLPLLPLLYFHGKRILRSVPKLAEAKGIEGRCKLFEGSTLSVKIISIGESTFAGVCVDTHSEAFTGTFAHEISKLFNLNVEWKVYARNGYTAKKV